MDVNSNRRLPAGDSGVTLPQLKCGFLKMELRINKGKQLAVPLAFVTCGRLAHSLPRRGLLAPCR